jgi:formylglycine-generating enzyme required for sulfatase activity
MDLRGHVHSRAGNVWQWTETPIDEFSGFRVHPVYDDFSVPTFDTRHNMIKGNGSIVTGVSNLTNVSNCLRL